MTELRLKFCITFCLAGLDAAWIRLAGASFELNSLVACVDVSALLAAFGIYYIRIRGDEPLGVMVTETAFLLVFSAAACVFSYLVTTIDRPMIDDTLARWDSLLGFDWFAYIRFARSHAWVGNLSSVVYQTTLIQVALAVVILPLLGKLDRVREMTLLVMVSAVLCVTISGIIPSAGALAYFHPPASFYMANHHPVVDLLYKQQFYDIRAGHLTHFGLTGLKGLVAFPSYHVALSVIIMLAFRGVRLWFWPIVALNTSVILSTPIDGGHHFVDGLGGAALALVTAAIVTRLRARLRQPEPANYSANCAGMAGQGA